MGTRSSPGAGRIAVVVAAALLAGAAAGPGAAAVTAAVAAPATAEAGGEEEAGHAGVRVREVAIKAADGTGLAATVYEPAGKGPFPLVVVPGPWIILPADHRTHAARYRALAASGYVVVFYDPRGFRRSGGDVELAGPADTSDLSEVVDWALAHTQSDPARVGALGASYGAGVALNAAARDARIRAVSALSGWADLSEGFRINGTRAASVVLFQQLFGRIDGRFGPAAEKAFDQAVWRGLDESEPWVRERSPRSHVTALNRNRTAVFMVGEWDDPLVPAGQMGSFLDQLAGPRQLRMYPGGHATSHAPSGGSEGRTPAWEEAVAWLDRYVRDRGAGPDSAKPVHAVVLEPRTGGPLEEYPSWGALTETARPVPLVAGPGGGRLVSGLVSAAESGLFPVAGQLDAAGMPASTLWPLLVPGTAASWTGHSLDRTLALRGSAVVEGVLVPAAADGTVIGHLYDLGPSGTARLLAHAPYTFRSQTPGKEHPVSLRLPATAWDVPAGHRLAVVFDTVDHRYVSENPAGAVMTIVPTSLHLTAPLTAVRRR
ncbi:CocE/NonD family hydrolase [Streptomyces sp. NPDC055254]